MEGLGSETLLKVTRRDLMIPITAQRSQSKGWSGGRAEVFFFFFLVIGGKKQPSETHDLLLPGVGKVSVI